MGEVANNFTVSKFIPLIKRFLANCPKKTCPPDWTLSALSDDDSKVWIYQGLWLRQAEVSDRILKPRRSKKMLDITYKEKRTKKVKTRIQKLIWGSLIPNQEGRIEIKGSFRTMGGRKSNAKQKKRSLEIHELLFT